MKNLLYNPMLEKWFAYEWVKFILTAVVLCIVITTAFWPLFNGTIIFEDDVTNYYLPAFKFYSDTLKTGDSFAMAPSIFSGFPLMLTQVGGFLDPVNMFIFKQLPFLTAYHLRIALNYFLAGMFVYLFARSLKLRFLSSLVAAFAYVTAQHIIPGANILRSNSYFLMPGLFFVTHLLYLRSRDPWSKQIAPILLGSIILCVSFLGGYTQLNLYGLVAVGFFTLFLLYRDFSWRFVRTMAIMCSVSGLMLLPYFLSVFELIPYTHRAGGLSWHDASAHGGSAAYGRALIHDLFVPRTGNGTLQSLYIGAISTCFFVLSLFYVRRIPLIAFFCGLLVFSVLAAFPYPLFWLMHLVPIFELFRFPPHWFFVSSFAIAILAALGAEHLSNASWPRGPMKSIQKFLERRTVTAGIILLLVLNFILPVRWLIAHESLPAQSMGVTPFVVEAIRGRERHPEVPFRTYQPYASDMSWLMVKARYSLPREIAYNFGREYTQTHLMPLLWNVDSIRGFDNLVTRRYARVLSFLEQHPFSDVVQPATYTRIDDTRMSLPAGTFALLGMMNVKYVWSLSPISKEHLVKEVSLLQTEYFPDSLIPINLYSNNLFLPRVYAPAAITILPEGEGTFSEIIERPHDFGKEGFIECACEGREFTQQGNVAIQNQKFRNDSVSFDAQASSDSWVVVSNAFVPGWVATIDGVETPIRFANYIYQGIRVPEGEHAVRIEYRGPYSWFFDAARSL